MQKAFLLAKPKICILLETELWPNFMKMCKLFHSKLYIVNARITEKTYKSYKKIQGILAEIAPYAIFATREKDKELYADLFPKTLCQFMYNIKFDIIYKELCLAMQNSEQNFLSHQESLDFPSFPEESMVFLFASTREQEEDMLFSFLLKLHEQKPKSILILAPRHVTRFQAWQEKFQATKIPLLNRSNFNMTSSFHAGDIILWDKFGELKKLFSLADYAFIGGSLVPLGGQNFLEALAYGIVPHTGMYLDNFLWTFETKEQKNLVESQLLIMHKNIQELEQSFLALPEKKVNNKADIQASFKTWLKNYIGDTKKIMQKIIEDLQ